MGGSVPLGGGCEGALLTCNNTVEKTCSLVEMGSWMVQLFAASVTRFGQQPDHMLVFTRPPAHKRTVMTILSTYGTLGRVPPIDLASSTVVFRIKSAQYLGITSARTTASASISTARSSTTTSNSVDSSDSRAFLIRGMSASPTASESSVDSHKLLRGPPGVGPPLPAESPPAPLLGMPIKLEEFSVFKVSSTASRSEDSSFLMTVSFSSSCSPGTTFHQYTTREEKS